MTAFRRAGSEPRCPGRNLTRRTVIAHRRLEDWTVIAGVSGLTR
jgi:hypothetical protein